MDRLRDVQSQGIARPGGYGFTTKESRELAIRNLSVVREEPVVLAKKTSTIYESAGNLVKTGMRNMRQVHLSRSDIRFYGDVLKLASLPGGVAIGICGVAFNEPGVAFSGAVGFATGFSMILAEAD